MCNKLRFNRDITLIISKYLMISKEDIKYKFDKVVKIGNSIYDSDIDKMRLYFALRKMFGKFTNLHILLSHSSLVELIYIYKTNEQLDYIKNHFDGFQYSDGTIRIYIDICSIPHKDLLILNNKDLLDWRFKHLNYIRN